MFYLSVMVNYCHIEHQWCVYKSLYRCWLEQQTQSGQDVSHESFQLRITLVILTPRCSWPQRVISAHRCRLDPDVWSEFPSNQPSLLNSHHLHGLHRTRGWRSTISLSGASSLNAGTKIDLLHERVPDESSAFQPRVDMQHHVHDALCRIKRSLLNILTSRIKPCQLSPSWNSSKSEMVKKVRKKT